MIATDEDAFICDMAETYQIFDYRSIPVALLATLSVGLRQNSRIKMKMQEDKVDHQTLLLATIIDKLSEITWMISTDGSKGVNRPASLVRILLDKPSDNETDIESFETPEEFEKARTELVRRIACQQEQT